VTQRVVLPPSPPAPDWAQQSAAVSTDENGVVVDLARLARAVRELAADLATARRDCRDKQRQIDSLQAENVRLRAAAGVVMRRDELAARRSAHEHALERMSSAVLVLRRGTLALKEENESLRLELARLREQETGRGAAASAQVVSRRGRRQLARRGRSDP
jgi:regulator of replication initiation timing